MPQRVLLVNDDAFELITLAEAMRLRGINVVGEAHTPSAAANLFKTLLPEVVVIDAQFDNHSGISLAKSMRKSDANLGLVITTACPDLRLIGLREDDIPEGSLIVLKRSISDLNALCDAIPDSIHALQRQEDKQWVNKYVSRHEKSFIATVNQLTDVQAETLRLVAMGMSNGEIGRLRYVSEKSVEQIVARIACHLGITPDRSHNLRVLMTNEYNKWIGAPRR
ncbi:MAG TPA: response regulator [Candidatus Nanopelagicaceae bacterium]|jgi:DNA-binding NarL/FixJ family response regulator